MAVGNHLIERAFDPIAIFLSEDKRGQEFHGMARVSSDLSQNPMLFAERDGDQLAEKSWAYRLEQSPCRLEFQGALTHEFDSNHEAFAADFPNQFIARRHRLQRCE